MATFTATMEGSVFTDSACFRRRARSTAVANTTLLSRIESSISRVVHYTQLSVSFVAARNQLISVCSRLNERPLSSPSYRITGALRQEIGTLTLCYKLVTGLATRPSRYFPAKCDASTSIEHRTSTMFKYWIT